MKSLLHRNSQLGFIEIVVLVVAALVLGGASYAAYRANHSHHTISPTSTPSASAKVSPQPSPGSPTPTNSKAPTLTPVVKSTPTPDGTTFTDSHNGQTVYIKLGSSFTVSLGSTYWGAISSSNNQVAQVVGAEVTTPNHNCVPGGGCGTEAQQFQASSAGQTSITSSRNSCGEAMGCTGDTGKFSLLVVVQP